MWQKWPTAEVNAAHKDDVDAVETAMEIIKAIRNIRAEAEAQPGRKLRAAMIPTDLMRERIDKAETHIINLAGLASIDYVSGESQLAGEMMSAIIDGVEIFVPLDDLVDFEVEIERLRKEKTKLDGEVARVSAMLANPNFVEKGQLFVGCRRIE